MPAAASSSTTSASASTSKQGANAMVDRFRTVGLLYTRRALAFRKSLRPTHHAQRRAARLDLQVDIAKAVACDPRAVSVNPLPILDTEPSPPPEPRTPPSLQWVYETHSGIQTVPRSAGSSSSSSEDEEEPVDAEAELAGIDMTEMIRRSADAQAVDSPISRPQNRPALRCIIPTIALNAPGPAEEELTSISLTSPVSSAIGPKGKRVDRQSGSSKLYISIPPRDGKSPVDMPTEARRMSWGCGEVAEREVAIVDKTSSAVTNPGSSASESSEGSGSSAASAYTTSSGILSSGLETPDDTRAQSCAPIMIRIKRSNSSLNSSETEVSSVHVEKRPKYDRKNYVRPAYARRPRSLNLGSFSPESEASPSLRSASTGPIGRR